MYTIVALGNPGSEYETTRHNIGWMVMHHIIARACLPKPHVSQQFSGFVSEGVLADHPVRIVFPTTFMNHSGASVKKVLACEPGTTLVVVHDDVDLPFGMVRLAFNRGAGGHNGVRSIIDHVGSNAFIRIRIGVARKNFLGVVRRPHGEALSRFVLSQFSRGELKQVAGIGDQVLEAYECICRRGIEAAMQEYN